MTKRSKISPEAPDLNKLKAKNPEALEARIAAMRVARERESGVLGICSDRTTRASERRLRCNERFRAKLGTRRSQGQGA